MGSMLSGPKREMIGAMKRALALLPLAAMLLAGCGGSSAKDNGEAAKAAAQVVSDAKAVAITATSVHVFGSGTSAGSPIAVNLYLVAGKGGRGMVTANGVTFQIVRIGDTAYFKGGATFWQHFGGSAAAALLEGRWLKAPATSGRFASFTPLTDIGRLFDAIIAPTDTLQNEGKQNVGGVSVVAIKDATKKGTLYVAATGKPYPVSIKKQGSGGITFTSWNAPVMLTAPPHAVDISALGG